MSTLATVIFGDDISIRKSSKRDHCLHSEKRIMIACKFYSKISSDKTKIQNILKIYSTNTVFVKVYTLGFTLISTPHQEI